MRYYTKEHEWIEGPDENTQYKVGVSDFAQSQLGDIVFVEFASENNSYIEKDGYFGNIEAVKTVSELFSPVSGTIVDFNDKIEDSPELVNDSPELDGWLITLDIEDPNDLNDLMNLEEYKHYTAND